MCEGKNAAIPSGQEEKKTVKMKTRIPLTQVAPAPTAAKKYKM